MVIDQTDFFAGHATTGMIAGVLNMLRTARDMRQVLGVDETPVSEVVTKATAETKNENKEFSDGS
jgi:cysteine synthase